MAYVGPHGGDVDIVGWQPNPEVRGTAEILTSCLVTLGLCVWTALHLNVAGNDGKYARFWAKIGWALVCLLAPELIVALAWHQRKRAKLLADHMNKELGAPPKGKSRFVIFCLSTWTTVSRWVRRAPPKDQEQPVDEEAGASLESQTSDRKHRWTTKHGFYARMGGFGLHVPVLPDEMRFLPEKEEMRFLITGLGMEFLAKFPDAHQDIPDLSERHIQSFSKSDGFAKFLVCCQAIWFCAQTIARLGQGLPISLLELNTLAHAICVLICFSLWWDKPVDVARPYFFESRFLHPAAAYERIKTTRSSIAVFWLETAKLYLTDQETRFDIVSHWAPDTDSQILEFQQPEEPDEESFRRFCLESQIESLVMSTAESAIWVQPVPGTGFQFLSFVPHALFPDISPLYVPGYPNSNRFGTVASYLSQWGLWSPALIPWALYVTTFALLTTLIPQVPQVGNLQDEGVELYDIFGPIHSDKKTYITRKNKGSESTVVEAQTLAEFAANRTLSIQQIDARALHTACHHYQLGKTNLIQQERLGEWSSSEVE